MNCNQVNELNSGVFANYTYDQQLSACAQAVNYFMNYDYQGLSYQELAFQAWCDSFNTKSHLHLFFLDAIAL